MSSTFALRTGATRGQREEEQWLLGDGPVEKCVLESSPLHRAASGGNISILRLLLSTTGQDVDLRTASGDTPLHRAARHASLRRAVMQLLLGKGADANAQANGMSALHIVASSGKEGFVTLLLDHCADVHLRTKKGGTALYGAAAGGHTSIVRLLLDQGADVNDQTFDGESVLHAAADTGNDLLAHLLLDKGADVNSCTTLRCETPLHRAARRGHSALVLLLLNSGAEVCCRNSSGETAEDLASAQGESRVAAMLRAGAARRNAAPLCSPDPERKPDTRRDQLQILNKARMPAIPQKGHSEFSSCVGCHDKRELVLWHTWIHTILRMPQQLIFGSGKVKYAAIAAIVSS